MKRQFLSILFLLFFVGVFSQTHSLTLEIKGCDNSGGNLMIAGFKGAKDFNKKENSAFNKSEKVENSTLKLSFHNIEEGDYAIAIYHDQNLDNKLNLNQIVIF